MAPEWALASCSLQARERFSGSNQLAFCEREVSQLVLRIDDARVG